MAAQASCSEGKVHRRGGTAFARGTTCSGLVTHAVWYEQLQAAGHDV